jgi:hypothetical protein
MEKEEMRKLCGRLSTQLGEHAEAVQVMVSWTDNNGTHRVFHGCGNWYARQGMAHEFIECDKAQTNAVEIASKLEPPPDDTEAWKKE